MKASLIRLALLMMMLVVLSSRASDDHIDDGFDDEEMQSDDGGEDGGEQVMDPRIFFLSSTGSSLLNLNTTAALLSLLGTAALLTALGFLIYHIVSSKLMAMNTQQSYSSYGGGSGGYGSGGYGSYGGSYGGGGFGSSYGGAGVGSYSAGGGGAGGYARSSDSMDWDSLKIIDYISVMEDMWRKLDVKDVNCQKRILCELHQNELALGPAASKIVNAFGYARYLSLLNIPEPLKNMIDDYQVAADKGRSMKDQECKDFYDSCEFSIKDTIIKKLKGHQD